MEKPENKLYILQTRAQIAQFIFDITSNWLSKAIRKESIQIEKLNTSIFNIRSIKNNSTFDQITSDRIHCCLEQLIMIKESFDHEPFENN